MPLIWSRIQRMTPPTTALIPPQMAEVMSFTLFHTARMASRTLSRILTAVLMAAT